MFKIDLHTHSTGSPDGGIKAAQYQKVLDKGLLDFVAITDHDTVELALQIQKELGERIIVGQEITTSKGEIIGLFLNEVVAPNQSPLATVKTIKAQGGLVYIPHPFETVRKGITETDLNHIADYVDIVEVHNGRAFFQNKGSKAATWASLHQKARAASSDAHGQKGLGHTYSLVTEKPDAANLARLLSESGGLIAGRTPIATLLYPKLHRLKNKVRRK